jgi:hypothetical protein
MNVVKNFLRCKGCSILDIVMHSVERFVNVFVEEKSNANPPL